MSYDIQYMIKQPLLMFKLVPGNRYTVIISNRFPIGSVAGVKTQNGTTGVRPNTYKEIMILISLTLVTIKMNHT